MQKIEELDKKLLDVIKEFCKENKDVILLYNSNYDSGCIHIEVIENE